MKSKAQLAREMYGCPLCDLSAGQLAAVSRRFKSQEAVATEPEATTGSGSIAVKFGRILSNGVKEVVVAPGRDSIQDAFKQTGMDINLSKEGFVVKKSEHYSPGQTVKLTDKVHDGDFFVITPGVDSSF